MTQRTQQLRLIVGPPRTIVRRENCRKSVAVGAVGAVVVTMLAACGAPVSDSTSAGSPAPAAPPAAVDPNAPEVNDPGDIPDNQVFVAYSPPGADFQVSVPEGWARTLDGPAVVFTDKFNSVRLEAVPRPTAPDAASARTDEFPAIASATPGFQPGKSTAVDRKAGPVVLITYTAISPPDPVTGKTVATAAERYEYWHNGQEVILTLAGPQGADNVDPWRTISDSVRWLR